MDQSVLEWLKLPPNFGYALLIIGLVLTLAPYLRGSDFGVIKIPDFDPPVRSTMRVLGPVVLLGAILIHVELIGNSENTSSRERTAVQPQDADLPISTFRIWRGWLQEELFGTEPPSDTAARKMDPPDTTDPQAMESVAETGSSTVILPAEAGATEVEPNNFLTEANPIQRGVFYAGQTNPDGKDGEDWYILPTPGISNVEVRFQVQSRGINSVIGANPEVCKIDVLDDMEQVLDTWNFADVGSSSYSDVFVEQSDFLLIRVYTSDWSAHCQYEIKAHQPNR